MDCVDSSIDYIPCDVFSKLIKALGATYCEEEHGKVAKKLKKDDKIYKVDFIVCIDWLFNDNDKDDETDNNDEDDKVKNDKMKVDQGKGWGNVFAQSNDTWKCSACFTQNDDEYKKCVACEAVRSEMGLCRYWLILRQLSQIILSYFLF